MPIKPVDPLVKQICESDPIIFVSQNVEILQKIFDFVAFASVVDFNEAGTSALAKLKMKFDNFLINLMIFLTKFNGFIEKLTFFCLVIVIRFSY